MSYKAMRIAPIVVPSLSIMFAACSLKQAPDEESGGTVAADQTINQRVAAAGQPVWGNLYFTETCVSKTTGPSIPSCPAVGAPCSPAGSTVTCKRPDPGGRCPGELGLFELTCLDSGGTGGSAGTGGSGGTGGTGGTGGSGGTGGTGGTGGSAGSGGATPGTPMATWQAFIGALNAGDQNAALNLLTPGGRTLYQPALTALAPVMTQLSRNWSAPQPSVIASDFATFLIMAQEPAGTRGHLVTLVRLSDQWFVDAF